MVRPAALWSALLLCLALGPAAVPLHAAREGESHRFVRVWPGWRDEESFRRLSEYFSGRENTGRQIVLRTHAGERSGLYFLARLRSPAAVAGAQFELEVVDPGHPEARVHRFAADVPAGQPVFLLGLTGDDWPRRGTDPVAWRLTLRAADGRLLAREESFLWAEDPRAR
jgi:hypothetical protein